jgi:ribosomal protein L19
LGQVDRFKITLRVFHEDLVPDEVTALLQCQPTASQIKGAHDGRFPIKGRWLFEIQSKDLGDVDIEDGLKILFEKLPTDLRVWEALTAKYKVDIFCGLFLAAENRGFGVSAEMSKMLADRGVEIGFDIYFDPPAKAG